jgi:exopolysaccharide production protein ExoZ
MPARCTVILAGHTISVHAIASFLFIPLTHPITGLREPVLQPGWSLNYEIFFYLLFSITLALRASWRFFVMTTLLAGLVGLGTMLPSSSVAAFYTNSIILEFLAGMAIAHFGWRLHWVFVPVGFALLAYGVPGNFGARIIWGGIPAAMIVAGALSIEPRLPRLRSLDLLGDASYAIYLTHMVTIVLIVAWTADRPIPNNSLILIAFVGSCAIGIATHIAVERPMLSWFKSRMPIAAPKAAGLQA